MAKIIGHWGVQELSFPVHDIGKRYFIEGWLPLYCSGKHSLDNDDARLLVKCLPGWPASKIKECLKTGTPLRCVGLVPSLPEINPTPGRLSLPYQTKWLSKSVETTVENDRDLDGSHGRV
jgi:hypothetical protein